MTTGGPGQPDTLRPARLADFGGQPDVTRKLGILLGAAGERGQLPRHMCFAGPPGLGKTSLAHIIATELNLPLIMMTGPSVQKPAELASMLSDMDRPSVVFIDEIHGLPRLVEEYLYAPMEDGILELNVNVGDRSKVVRLELEQFVLIGATTQLGRLTKPLRDRFGYTGRLKLYAADALATIVTRSAGLLDVPIAEDGALLIAERSQGTPRLANQNLHLVRDWAQVHKRPAIDAVTAEAAMDDFGVDAAGLDDLARDILTALVTQFNGGPVGLKTLAASVGEADTTIEDVYEAHLMRSGLLVRTPRGRAATAKTYMHLGLTPPPALVLNEITEQQDLPFVDEVAA